MPSFCFQSILIDSNTTNELIMNSMNAQLKKLSSGFYRKVNANAFFLHPILVMPILILHFNPLAKFSRWVLLFLSISLLLIHLLNRNICHEFYQQLICDIPNKIQWEQYKRNCYKKKIINKQIPPQGVEHWNVWLDLNLKYSKPLERITFSCDYDSNGNGSLNWIIKYCSFQLAKHKYSVMYFSCSFNQYWKFDLNSLLFFALREECIFCCLVVSFFHFFLLFFCKCSCFTLYAYLFFFFKTFLFFIQLLWNHK